MRAILETNCLQIMTNSKDMQNRESRVEQLRKKHPRFIYDGFNYEYLGNKVKIHFQFILEPGIVFTPETIIETTRESAIAKIDSKLLEKFIFHLGLIELLSYWKATCSPEVIIKAGFLDENQLMWWKSLLFNGMMEFFYVNKINFKSPDFLDVVVAGYSNDRPLIYEGILPQQDRNLVMTSGGKDSALTLQFLKEAGENFNCLLVNPTSAAREIAKEVECHAPIIVKRTLDPKLFDLNKAGYLNGHTPFSSLIAVLGVTCAVLFGYNRVIASNERSSNESYVGFLGNKVNHQYSKSFHFERAFQEYVQSYFAKNVSYFSLLRPLYEVQIASIFAKYPQYFDNFKSCNVNQHKNSWCLRCAKCLSTFIALYPFLQPEDITRIFGKDIFEDEGTIPLILELVGLHKHKPFECVGTKEEIIAALFLSIQQARKYKKELPVVLRYIELEIIPRFPEVSQLAKKVLSDWNEEHNLPQGYESNLKKFFGYSS